MKKIIIPIPSTDFDPTEVAIPWNLMIKAQVKVEFATPDGRMAECDQRMLRGYQLGIFKGLLMAYPEAITAYIRMENSNEFVSPKKWEDIRYEDYDGILLPGGHAQGMKPYLESKILQDKIVDFFTHKKLVAAICHGIVLAARSKKENGDSVLKGYQTTSLLATQELLAWGMTFLWLGNYYRTYPMTVEKEVKNTLASYNDFKKGPLPINRDSINNLNSGFVVKDRNYISARWPGDAHTFGQAIVSYLSQSET